VQEARALIDARDRAAHSIAVLLRPDITGTVMTHSASATVREAVLHAGPARVVCTVSDPHGEGRRLVDDLTEQGLTAELVADGDAAHAVTTVDILVVGADSVFRDGSLVNKVGTNDLAKAANEARVPVVVACETFKLAPFDPTGEPKEETFDLTPAERIDRYVTEEGVFPPDEVAALIDRTPFLRDGYALLSLPAPG
jgi:translation initiation factor 2B subunit (eIF-2B alpha/beta/delta family)